MGRPPSIRVEQAARDTCRAPSTALDAGATECRASRLRPPLHKCWQRDHRSDHEAARESWPPLRIDRTRMAEVLQPLCAPIEAASASGPPLGTSLAPASALREHRAQADPRASVLLRCASQEQLQGNVWGDSWGSSRSYPASLDTQQTDNAPAPVWAGPRYFHRPSSSTARASR